METSVGKVWQCQNEQEKATSKKTKLNKDYEAKAANRNALQYKVYLAKVAGKIL